MPTPSLATTAAAEAFVAAASAAIEARGKFMVALSGGTTPRRLYQELAGEQFDAAIDWHRVHFFWGDERCVAPDDGASNFRMASESLLDKRAVLAANVHRIHGEMQPSRAASVYEEILRSEFLTPSGVPDVSAGARFDLILLGLGDDGHTASLFPDDTRTHSSMNWMETTTLSPDKLQRITMTPLLLNAAAEVVFFVVGGSKANAVGSVLEGPHQPHRLPAQLIAPTNGEVCWIMDSAAASSLAD